MGLLNQLSIKSKLIIMLLTVSSCSILVTAYLGYRNGQTNLTTRVFSQLTSLRASKADQIKSYFKTIRNHTQTLSEDLMVINAMADFDRAYRQLNEKKETDKFEPKIVEYYRQEFLPRLAKTSDGSPVLNSYLPKNFPQRYLQYYYIAANPHPVGKKHLLDKANDGSTYSQIHARYHPRFRQIIEKFGYYDLFLIAPDGTIVYTVFKETDFTSNLEKDAYRDSNLAALAQSISNNKGRNYTKIVDFEGYQPSYGAPAAFIAAPIFNQSEFIGVLAFQLPVNEINRVMTGDYQWKRDGLGNTGETYLVGTDYLMRSISRFLVETPQEYTKMLRSIGVSEKIINRINKYQTSILQQKVETIGVKEAKAGKQGTQIIKDYRGIPVLSSYAPLQLDDLEWVILSEIDLAEAYAPIYEFQKQMLISATVLMLVVTLIAMVLAKLFVKPIHKLMASAAKVSAGEIDAVVSLNSEDELGELAKSFNAMVKSLRSQNNLIEEKNRENEQLLLSFFPAAIAKRLKQGEKDIAESVSNVSVLFSELTGFSKLSEEMTAYEIVATLNDLVNSFDEGTEKFGLEKIKTIGDNYMAVCGLSVAYLDHDRRAIDFALEMLSIVRRFNYERGFELNIKIGINSGDVVAGIVGRNKFIYDVWGNTINIAGQMKSACPPGSIIVSSQVYHRLHELYNFENFGSIDIKGQQAVTAWVLKNNKAGG